MDVDTLFKERIQELGDWRGERLIQLRKIVEKAAPVAELTWKWGSPVWTQNGLLLSLGSFSDHVKIHFFKGASVADADGLFNAGLEAKLTRGIDIFKDDTLDEGPLMALIEAAVNHNIKK
jgi:hypothetical protein